MVHVIQSYSLNKNIKICNECKFFISRENKCKRVAEIDFVNGNHNYLDAFLARKNETLCGYDAVYFEKDYLQIFNKDVNDKKVIDKNVVDKKVIHKEGVSQNTDIYDWLNITILSTCYIIYLYYIYLCIHDYILVPLHR
jgi:hypothetical protein